jgi:pimeloyl-ACP methyl ester carboxylesterase
MSLFDGVQAKGLVLINTLRKPSERLNWINNAMANAVKFGGTSLILDMTLPVIASPKFLSKMKDNALNYENYLGLDDYNGISKLMHGGFTTNWNFDWSKLDLPVLVLTGHFDKVFRIEEDINDLIKNIKNVKRIEVPECGHLIPLEDPELFSYHLNAFIISLKQ